MRPRERILANLESIYRESYDRAKTSGDGGRMIDLDSAYMRDQLMLEILLDIRDLFSVAPAALGRQRAREARSHPPAHQTPLSDPMLPCASARRLSHLCWSRCAACAARPAPARPTWWSTAGSGPATPPRPWAGAVAVAGDTVAAVGDSATIARAWPARDPGARQRRRDGDARLHGRPPPLHRRRLPARQRRPPAGQRRRRSSSPGSRRTPRSAGRASGSWAATGITSAGPRAPPAPRVDRLRHAEQSGVRLPARRPHGPRQLAALRAAGITRATRDIPGGVIVRDRRTGRADRHPQGRGDGAGGARSSPRAPTPSGTRPCGAPWLMRHPRASRPSRT